MIKKSPPRYSRGGLFIYVRGVVFFVMQKAYICTEIPRRDAFGKKNNYEELLKNDDRCRPFDGFDDLYIL